MVSKKIMIVITNYEDLISSYEPKDLRIRWGVLARPILNNGNWLLPLGWESELDKVGINYEVKEIDFYIQDIL